MPDSAPDPDSETGFARLLDRLAEDAPPPPDGVQLRRRWRARLRRRTALGAGAAAGLALVIGWLLPVAHPAPTDALRRAETTAALRAPLPTSVPAPGARDAVTAIDPAIGNRAVVAAIVACLAPPADASLNLRKRDGILQVTGTTGVPLARLAILDHLLGRITALDLCFVPGAPPRLRYLTASDHS